LGFALIQSDASLNVRYSVPRFEKRTGNLRPPKSRLLGAQPSHASTLVGFPIADIDVPAHEIASAE
jgi:hypothetical protein